jgi:hypothetical protein
MHVYCLDATDRAKPVHVMHVYFRGERVAVKFENGVADLDRELAEYLIEVRRAIASSRSWVASRIIHGARLSAVSAARRVA